MAGVRQVLDRDFTQVVLGSATPVVCGLAASHESWAEEMQHALTLLATAMPTVLVVQIDTDAAPVAAAAYRVGSTPCVLVFDRGRLVLALPGSPDPTTLTDLVSTALASTPTNSWKGTQS